jgi:hypothetical protein
MGKHFGVLILGGLLLVALAAPRAAQSAHVGFGFNGVVSGFPTGVVRLTGGGAFDLATGFVNSAGGFRCLQTVDQGPLKGCLTGEGVRWDTVELLSSTPFRCTGDPTETLKTAETSDTTVVLLADFYRAGDANDESFTARIIVSETDIAPDIPGVQTLWIQGVGCGTAIVNFSQ